MPRTGTWLRWTVCASFFLAALVPVLGCKRVARQRSAADASAEEVQVKPSRDLSPDDVVRIQVQCLSDAPNESLGLRTAFGFSSPQHRVLTGSFADYQELMDTPQFRALRECVSVDYFEPEIDGNRAQQIVALTDAKGEVSFYLFELSRQPHGDFQGCWMTDAVQTSLYKHQSGATSSAST